MKSTGVVRQLDQLGRIVIPIELRRTLDISTKDHIEFFTEGDAIILKKFERSCIFCESTEHLVYWQGKPVCSECIKQMQKSMHRKG